MGFLMLARIFLFLFSCIIFQWASAAQIYVAPPAASSSASQSSPASNTSVQNNSSNSGVSQYQYPSANNSLSSNSTASDSIRLPSNFPSQPSSKSAASSTPPLPTTEPQIAPSSITTANAGLLNNNNPSTPSVPPAAQSAPEAITPATPLSSPSTNTNVEALIYGSAAKEKWMQGCIAGASMQPNVKQYAQPFCECGWNKLSSGMVPAQLWISQNPQNIERINSILTAIREQCQVEIQAQISNTNQPPK